MRYEFQRSNFRFVTCDESKTAKILLALELEAFQCARTERISNICREKWQQIESAALNKTGRALDYTNKSIVMKGWGISCASSSSSVVNYGCVSLSLVLQCLARGQK